MAALCSPSLALPDASDNLISLLQHSISCIHDDDFHPVLYQALSALHEYIGTHQQRLIQTSSSADTSITKAMPWKKSRPSFCRDLHGNNNGVIASGWLEEMVTARNEDRRGIEWEQVLLLLVVPGLFEDNNNTVAVEEEPYLRIAYGNHSDLNSTSALAPELSTGKQVPLRSLFFEYQDVFGDPRLILGKTDSEGSLDGEVVTLRCDHASAAKAWISELESFLRDEESNSATEEGDLMVDQSVEVAMDDNDGDIVHVMSWEDNENVEKDPAVRDSKNTENVGRSHVAEPTGNTDLEVNPEPKPDTGTTLSSPLKAQQSLATRKQVAEEKMEELDAAPLPTSTPKTIPKKDLKDDAAKPAEITKLSQKPLQPPQSTIYRSLATHHQSQARTASVAAAMHKPTSPQQPQRPAPQKQPAQPAQGAVNSRQAPAMPMTQIDKEMRVEQQKKLAAERRRQDLELQRKLAREQQKRKDLEAKRKFLEKEQRKQELVAKAQRPSSNNDTAALLRQLVQQIGAVDIEIRDVQTRADAIKAEIEQRKRQPLQGSVTQAGQQPTLNPGAAAQKLEAQKKAAVEKRRQELEAQRRRAREEQKRKEEQKKRRFMEHEQRKQDLMAKAKENRGHVDNSALMKKMNNQMSALDAEAGRKRAAGESKRAAEREEHQKDEKEDPESARKRIAEQARQQQLHEEVKHSSSSSPTTEKGNVPSPMSSSHTDPFEHLQGPARQSVSYPQGNMYRTSPTNGAPPGHPQSPLTQSPRTGTAPFFTHNPTAPISPPHYPSGGHQSPPQPPYQASPTKSQSHPPSQNPAASSPPSASQRQPPSGMNQKYGKMATQTIDDEQSLHTELKRKIIVGWALNDMKTGLRSIDLLLMTIQTVFPPANNLPAHVYFDGWKTVSDGDLRNGQVLDEKKLSKSVRKLRFFLHPDKLPRDLDDQQQFVCKLLWDISNDAFAEYKKAAEELDWMH